MLGVVPMEDMDLVVVPKNPGPGGSFALSPLPARHG